jgi:hypothetical protein
MSVQIHEWYDKSSQLEIRTNNLEITISGQEIEVRVEGYGGYGCSSHTERVSIDFRDAILIRDYLNEHLIDRQSDCDHTNRKYDTNDEGSPGFSCSDCGYGT